MDIHWFIRVGWWECWSNFWRRYLLVRAFFDAVIGKLTDALGEFLFCQTVRPRWYTIPNRFCDVVFLKYAQICMLAAPTCGRVLLRKWPVNLPIAFRFSARPCPALRSCHVSSRGLAGPDQLQGRSASARQWYLGLGHHLTRSGFASTVPSGNQTWEIVRMENGQFKIDEIR